MSDFAGVKKFVYEEWDKTVIPCLSEYIKVPSQSPEYDKEWATNGLQEKAFDVLIDWLKAQPVKGMKYELLKDPGLTPFLIIEIDGTTPTEKTLFMYGHMDKQPPLPPWDNGLDPYKPVIRDGKLYGRGGADDGYAICAAIVSIVALQKHNIPHARTVVVIEGDEESGSTHLPHYIQKLKARIGDVDLIVCLDSGAQNYDQVWLTTSLRGVCCGVLSVQVLTEGMHSGMAGGVVPDSFRIARSLLDRIENSVTGEVLIKEAFCEIPEDVRKGMKALNDLGPDFRKQFTVVPGMKTEPGDNLELGLRSFWQPSITVVGDNLPECPTAGNVIRACTKLKLSVRCPPLVKAAVVSKRIAEILEKDPPYGCRVKFEAEIAGNGWAAPPLQPWLHDALNRGSQDAFGKPYGITGIGGSIPFMGMLGELFPEAQFVVTGVLGPNSNAHGPNEFLHIDFAKGITLAIARVAAEHKKNTK